MRAFWILLALLVLAGLGYPAYQAISARSHQQRQATLNQATSGDITPMETKPAAPTAITDPPKVAEPTTTPVPTPTPAAAPPAPSVTITAPEAQPEAQPAANPVPNPDTSTAPNATQATTPATSPTPPAADTAAPTPAARVTKNPDGSITIDDRFTVQGNGTADKPYEVTWELLTSIQEAYDPRQGRKKLPERLTMFDGTYVRVTGYIAYPMFVEQPRELLAMLNQWDGCCIGVPPTPYDAVEVHLKDAATKEQRLAVFGSLEGKFLVKPFLAGDWLVGLYVMEDATISVKQVGGFGS